MAPATLKNEGVALACRAVFQRAAVPAAYVSDADVGALLYVPSLLVLGNHRRGLVLGVEVGPVLARIRERKF